MLVFGTQVHLVTFIFIVLEFMMFSYQMIYYLFRPQDKKRMWYLILLVLMLFYNITGGLFPDPKIPISISLQEMVAYGSGFLMASFFPFYFYKVFDLKPLRWHALFGVPLFLILPYLIFFVVVYAINGKLNVDIKYGMIVPFTYALVLLWVMFRAIHKNHESERDEHKYTEEIAMYFAISPWAALAFFGLIEASQLIEVLCTNTGIMVISVLFISQSISNARNEYEQLKQLGRNNDQSGRFKDNCISYQLTIREIEIVVLLRQGLTYKGIADQLFISEKTVDNHLQNIYLKIGVKNKVALIHKLDK